MLVFHKVEDIQNHIQDLKINSKTIGFVPTMGALHEGHLSLIQNTPRLNAISNCRQHISSIPTQFNDKKDFR
jgi:pantoate--beta-alanine ligase